MPEMIMEKMVVPFEIKEQSEEGVFEGHAAVFNLPDSYKDIIRPGAFKKTLKKKGPKGIRVLWQHQYSSPIGVTLEAEEDKKGLFVKGQLLLDMIRDTDTPTTPDAWRAYTAMKRKAIGGLSIGFYADPSKQDWDDDRITRYLNEIDLWEYSPVTFPAALRAKITGVKSAKTERELEMTLRDVGLSWSESRFLAARHQFRSLRDVGTEAALAELMSVLDSTNHILEN